MDINIHIHFCPPSSSTVAHIVPIALSTHCAHCCGWHAIQHNHISPAILFIVSWPRFCNCLTQLLPWPSLASFGQCTDRPLPWREKSTTDRLDVSCWLTDSLDIISIVHMPLVIELWSLKRWL